MGDTNEKNHEANGNKTDHGSGNNLKNSVGKPQHGTTVGDDRPDRKEDNLKQKQVTRSVGPQGQEEDKTSKGGGRGRGGGEKKREIKEKEGSGSLKGLQSQGQEEDEISKGGRGGGEEGEKKREIKEKEKEGSEKFQAPSSGPTTEVKPKNKGSGNFLQIIYHKYIKPKGGSSNTETSPKGHDGKVASKQGDSVDPANEVDENDPPNGTEATSKIKEEPSSHDHVDKGQVDDGQVNEEREGIEKQEKGSGDSVDTDNEVGENDPTNGTDATSEVKEEPSRRGHVDNGQVDEERESTEKQEKGSRRRMSDEADTSNATDDEFEMWFKKLQDSSRQVASAVGQAIMQRDTVTALKVYQNVEAKLNSQIFYPSRPKCLVYVENDDASKENVNSLQEAYKGLDITVESVHHLDELSYSDKYDFIIIHIVSEVDEEEETRILDKLQLGNDARPHFVMIQRSANDEELNDLTFTIQNSLIVRSKHPKMTEVFTKYLKKHGEKNDISILWKFTEEALQHSHNETNSCTSSYGGLSKNVFLTEHDEYSEKQLVWTHK